MFNFLPPMSKTPKGVSFEEYRNKSWHDVCKMLGDEDDPYRYNNISSQENRSRNNSFKDISNSNETLTKLPPPLEPRECLVASRIRLQILQ
ncbi:hypothetical protein Ocin01_01334 [Orchesella cincta]|uniref:Uncharacterized protein n=1 Tax=Orchesella cincta TaxID=48709 RepID=A0A1D2NJF7_ORCCI|nr:hypothetical protein Ocin01_01334 [Orchesella cincta]